MANRYVRSIFWLVTCTGLGYGLLIATTPSETDIEKLKKKLPGLERNSKEYVSKNQQFVNVLQSASENKKPLYRLSKDEIESEYKK